jgi:hypothetical protein
MRRVIPALVLAVSALAPAALAQDKTPKKSGVTISFRGLGTQAAQVLGKPRRFVPITAVLENTGDQDADGLLRVYRSQEVAAGVTFSAVPEQALFYERPVKVPRGGKRVEEISYYCQDHEPDRICVAFEAANGETIVASPHPALSLHGPELLALSITSSDQDEGLALGGGNVPGPRRTYELQVKHGDPASLPERPEGYGAFDFVILSELDPRAITPRQAHALVEWVELGGDLLVAASPKEGEALSAIEELELPVMRAKADPIELRELSALETLFGPGTPPLARSPVPVRRVIPRPGARVLAGTADDPLIVRGSLGAGRITYFPFPLASLRSVWGSDKDSPARALVALCAHPPREDLEAVPTAPPLEEVLLNFSEAVKNADPPSALVVAPLLILYVTLVAPLNYIILTRIGKRDFAMLTAAIIAVLFGVLFYAIGWAVHGSGALLARGAIVELPPSKDMRARVETMTGYFSTDRGVVDARAPRGSSIAPIAERPNGRGAHVIETSDPTLKAVELDTWSLRRFRTVRLERLGAVSLDLSLDGGMLAGTVTNETPWVIETPVILIGNRCVELNDLRPGDKVQLNQTPGDSQHAALLTRLLRGLHKDAFKSTETLGYGQSDPFQGDASARLRAALQRRLESENAGPGALPAIFLGCVERDLGGVDMESGATVELARALVLEETAVTCAGDRLNLLDLPPVVSRHRKSWEPSMGATGSPGRLAFDNPANEPGTVTFEWRVPASHDVPFDARSFELSWDFGGDPDPDQTMFKLYDWSAGRFEVASVRVDNRKKTWTKSKAADMGRYVDRESGLIRIQLETGMTELPVKDVTLTVNGARLPRQR